MTTDQTIDDILRREGGYVAFPEDRGGCTNRGITIETLGVWRGRPVTCADVEALTESEARAIYRSLYVDRPGFDAVRDDRLRALLIDWGVHSGPRTAIRGLQAAIGAPVDGILGPQTIAVLGGADAVRIYRLVLQARMSYVADILQRNASQRLFASGWLRRLADFV